MKNKNNVEQERLRGKTDMRMTELDESKFQTVTPFFKDIQHSIPLVNSVLEQTYPGKVYVGNMKKPSVVLVTFDDCLFIAGDIENDLCNSTLYEFLYDEVIPKSKWQYFEFYTTSDEWEEKLDKIFKKKICIKRVRKTFKLNKECFYKNHDWKTRTPEGGRIGHIDDALIEKYNLDKEFWDPKFKRFGFCLIKDDEIVSKCEAVFIGGCKAEISIETEEAHRRQNFAFLTSIAFIEYCLSIGLEPNWGCWEERESSIALAKKNLGLRKRIIAT